MLQLKSEALMDSRDRYSKTAVENALEQIEGGAVRRAIARLEDTTTHRLLDDAMNGPAARMLLDIENSSNQHAFGNEIDRPNRFAATRVLDDAVHRLTDMNRLPAEGFDTTRLDIAMPRLPALRGSTVLAALQRIGDQQAEVSLSLQRALGPYSDMSRGLAKAMATIVPSYPGLSLAAREWETILGTRLGRLQTSWLAVDIERSMVGFAHLLRLSDALRYERPFAAPVRDLVFDELGDVVEEDGEAEERDEAAAAAGLNTDLVAFEPESYGHVIARAGLEIILPPIVVPEAIENADRSAAFDHEDHLFVDTFENAMRQFLLAELVKLEGGLKRHVPGQIMDRWKLRQQEARDEGRAVYPLIWYADLMDMSQIIDGKLVYAVVGPILGPKTDVLTSFLRLHPIRKALAHGRPIGQADRLVMTVEVTRLLTALGHNVFR